MPEKQDRFLCSICIPTYNRADLLRETLTRLTRERSFLEKKVEVVISNNASTDHTDPVCREFQQKHPDQVKYIGLKEGIDPHFNFQNALNHGSGKFIKLNTDSNVFDEGQLDKFIGLLEQFQDEADLVFPLCFPRRSEEFIRIENCDELLKYASFHFTSINSFCVKRETYLALEDPFRAWKINFPHVDMAFRILQTGKKAVIFNHIVYFIQRILYNSQRNHAEIFAHNYVSLLDSYVKQGEIRRKTFQKEKRLVLFQYIIPYHFDFFHQYNELSKPLPFWPHTDYYRKDCFFYAALLWIAFYWFTSRVIPIHQMLGWIKRNIFRIR